MNTIAFNRLAFIDRMKEGGFNDGQCRAASDAFDQALRETVATKADLLALELRLTFRLGAITVATVAAMTAFITIILTVL